MNFLKYLIKIVIACLILKYLPYSKKNSKELIIIVLIFIVGNMLIDNSYGIINRQIKNAISVIDNFSAESMKCTKVCSNGSEPIEKCSINKPNEAEEVKASVEVDKDINDDVVVTVNIPDNKKDSIKANKKYPKYESDMNFGDFSTIPVPTKYQSKDYEYGYSFLPPEKWFPTPLRSPVCKTEKQCPVCPTFTQGTPIDVKEWDNSRKVLQPDTINIEYIAEKLNKIENYVKNN